MHPFRHSQELALDCFRHRYRPYSYSHANGEGRSGLRRARITEFCERSTHHCAVDRNQVLAFVARQCGAKNEGNDLLALTKKECDPDLSRTPLDERDKHQRLVMLQTKLLRRIVIDIREW